VKLLFFVAALAMSGSVYAAKTEYVEFVNPKDGATVKSPFTAEMKVVGKKLNIAGENPDDKTLGHHHIIVDGGPTPKGVAIPADATHLHFGKAQMKTELSLPPGDHKLTLQFADGAHRSYGEEMSKTITVHVTQ
jgi:hypothetical protein